MFRFTLGTFRGKISFEQNHEHTDTQTLIDILIEASQEVAPKRTKRKAKHMNIWNDEIAIALKNSTFSQFVLVNPGFSFMVSLISRLATSCVING
jgi:hypothetical protein